MPTKCLYIALVILVTVPNLVLSQAPITWPDPRHFKISLDRNEGTEVTATWEVEKYCKQNNRLEFSAFATGPDGSIIESANSYERAFERIVLSKPSTKYTITGTVRTRFDPREINASLTVVSAAPKPLGRRQARPFQEVKSATSRGDGPHVVVLKDNATQECLLVIYDAKTTSDSYSIEGTKLCRKGSLPKTTVLLPMEVEPREYLPGMKNLKFNLPETYVRDLPNFIINTGTIQSSSSFELDPPQDVYGVLNLDSPESATLFLTFRPPASHPKLIKSFTFEFNNQNEKIVYRIIDDKDANSTSKHSLTMSRLIAVQEHPKDLLEVHPQSKFKYPGKYTVTVYTNDAKKNKHIIPIIMPNFEPLAPRDYEITVSGHDIVVKWGEPHYFGKSCNYRVQATPVNGKGVPISDFVAENKRWVKFESCSLATEYEITLRTRCGDGDEIFTILGRGKTGPREPGIVQNLRIEVIKIRDVRLSWNPPEVMEGDSHHYTYECSHDGASNPHSGQTNETSVTIENVAPGKFSCVVYATSSSEGHDAKKGLKSDPVSVYVPSNLISAIPEAGIKRINKSAVDLKIGTPEEGSILAMIIDVDSVLRCALFPDDITTPMNITYLKSSKIKIERKGLTSFLLNNLIDTKKHVVKVAFVFSANPIVENTYIINENSGSSYLNYISERKADNSDIGENQTDNTKLACLIVLGIVLFALLGGIFIWQFKQWRSKNDPLLLDDVSVNLQ